MDDQNGHARLVLQGSEVVEQRSHLTGHILIGGVKTDQGIEDQKGRAMTSYGSGKPVLIDGAIQIERVGGNDTDVELVELKLVMVGQRLQPQATETAISSVRKLLRHLGAPPSTPTACAVHKPSISQRRRVGAVARAEARTTGRDAGPLSPSSSCWPEESAASGLPLAAEGTDTTR